MGTASLLNQGNMSQTRERLVVTPGGPRILCHSGPSVASINVSVSGVVKTEMVREGPSDFAPRWGFGTAVACGEVVAGLERKGMLRKGP